MNWWPTKRTNSALWPISADSSGDVRITFTSGVLSRTVEVAERGSEERHACEIPTLEM